MDKLEQFEHEMNEDVLESNVDEFPNCKIYRGKQALDEYKALKERYGEGTSTGYSRLNDFFKFLPGQLYLLSGSTHTGKTLFSVNMCSYISLLGKKVLFISLEQGVFVADFIHRILGKNYPETLSLLDTTKMLTVNELLDILKMVERQDLICLDHLHFIKRSGMGATEDIDEIIHELQNLAKEIETPILTISHLRKLNTNKPPTMDDLKNSSSLAQVPSVVMMIYRREKDDGFSDEGVLFIRKNRIQGKTGSLKFRIVEKFKIVFEDDIVREGNGKIPF